MKKTLAIAVLLLCACSSSTRDDGVAGSAGTGGTAGAGGSGGSEHDASPDVEYDAGSDAEDASDASDAALGECPRFAPGSVVGSLDQSELDEVSGLCVSRKNSHLLWLHNDSGDSARVLAARDDGVLVGVFALGAAGATDWEDIALGPGPVTGEDYLYLADIGDNDEERANVVVYRVPEPVVSADGGPQTGELANVEALTFVYPDAPHNAETLLVDPRSGDLFIVTKSSAGSQVFRAAAPLGSAEPRTLELVTTLGFGTPALPGSALATGGDIGASGDVLIRSYDAAFLWRRRAGSSVSEALQSEPCPVPIATEPQGESIGFSPAEGGYFTASEDSAALYFYARLP